MATHSSSLAWKIPWTEEPGGLQSMGSLESDMTEWLHFHCWLSCIGEGNGNPLQCSCLENPRDGKPGGLPSVGSHRVRHDWSDLAAAARRCGEFWRKRGTGFTFAFKMFPKAIQRKNRFEGSDENAEALGGWLLFKVTLLVRSDKVHRGTEVRRPNWGHLAWARQGCIWGGMSLSLSVPTVTFF